MAIFVPLVVFFFIATIIQGHGQNTCLENSNIFKCYLSTKTAYRNIANYNTSRLEYPGCTEKKLWMLSRHGTRYPPSKQIKSMNKILPVLKEKILQAYKNGQGKLSQECISAFENWSMNFNQTHAMLLQPEGRRELFELGRRMKERFPLLFSKPYSNETYRFRFTGTQRTEESTKAFVNGILGDQNVLYPVAKRKDPLLRFEEYCHKWKIDVHKNPTTNSEKKKFSKHQIFEDIQKEVSDRIGFTLTQDDMSSIYTICAYETAWNPSKNSPWCDLFTSLDHFKVFQYKKDLAYYYEDGYGAEINHKQACPLFLDLFEFFKSEKQVASVYFSHSPILLKFLSSVGIAKDEKPLTSDSFVLEGDNRKWKSGHINPFANNIAFISYDCTVNGEGIILLHQERVVPIPGCPINVPCPLKTMKQLYPSTKEECDFNKICQNPN